jgi:amino acid transporter
VGFCWLVGLNVSKLFPYPHKLCNIPPHDTINGSICRLKFSYLIQAYEITARCRGNLAFMAEELKEPERNIPRGTVGGISIVMVIYVGLT